MEISSSWIWIKCVPRRRLRKQWNAALKDVDDALKDGGETRDDLGVTLWDTTSDLIYTGHSDLAWRFVREANPDAFKGSNPTFGEFCSELKHSVYWSDLEPTLKDVPEECKGEKGKRPQVAFQQRVGRAPESHFTWDARRPTRDNLNQ